MRSYSISQRNRSQGSRTWYGRIRDSESGKTSYLSLKTTKKREAEEWLSRMCAERFLPERAKPNDVAVREAVQSWLRGVEMAKGGYSRTVELYATHLRPLAEWCAKNGVIMLSEFTPVQFSRAMAPKATPVTTA